VLQGLISAARDRNIKLRIVNNIEKSPSSDTVDLVNAGMFTSAREVMFLPLNVRLSAG